MRALALMSVMLEQILQLVQGEAEVSGHLPELAVSEFDPVVVAERHGAAADLEDDVRAALAQPPKTLLQSSPDLSSLTRHVLVPSTMNSTTIRPSSTAADSLADSR